MATVFFPGKFQPVHLGHIISIMNIYDKYDKIIIGITVDIPEILSPNERKEIFETVFKHLNKVEVILIKKVISGSRDLSHLPAFDICLTGNSKVIETMSDNGLNASFLERSIGIGYSGTEIRSLL
jgi:cytidyltransferase-like protein